MDPFCISHFRLVLVPQKPLILPDGNVGNVIRGAFGTVFHNLCCNPSCRDARKCDLRYSCPYAQVFQPGAPLGSDALSKLESIPRGFVFRAPATGRTRYEPGERLVFELLLFGSAIKFFPYFVVSLSQLATEGFGTNRAPTTLTSVMEMGAGGDCSEIYSTRTGTIRSPQGSFGLTEIRRHFPVCPTNVAVRFVSPTHLVSASRAVASPAFHHFFKRVRDRVNALATFYGSGKLPVDFKELGNVAERVTTVRQDTRWEVQSRKSTRTGQGHDYPGFVGECEFSGDLTPFWDWLLLGQYCHVGKHAVWGNGQFVMECCGPAAMDG